MQAWQKHQPALTDGVLRICCSLVHDRTGSGVNAIRAHLDVGTNNLARSAEQVLQVLPPDRIRQLRDANKTSQPSLEGGGGSSEHGG